MDYPRAKDYQTAKREAIEQNTEAVRRFRRKLRLIMILISVIVIALWYYFR